MGRDPATRLPPSKGHTATHPGKMVRLVLINGSVLEGRFLARDKKKFIHLDTGKVHRRLVHQFLILRGGKSRPGE